MTTLGVYPQRIVCEGLRVIHRAQQKVHLNQPCPSEKKEFPSIFIQFFLNTFRFLLELTSYIVCVWEGDLIFASISWLHILYMSLRNVFQFTTMQPNCNQWEPHNANCFLIVTLWRQKDAKLIFFCKFFSRDCIFSDWHEISASSRTALPIH